MIGEIRAFGLLRGARGQKPADLDAVVDVLVRISHLAKDLPEIMELDINPLIVGNAGEGVWAADVRIGIGGTS
jgi:acyl-CoA synthetase (NDP forming)